MHCVTSWNAALDLPRQERVDAAFIDPRMPGMDGAAILKEIRTAYPRIMSIMTTGAGRVREAV